MNMKGLHRTKQWVMSFPVLSHSIFQSYQFNDVSNCFSVYQAAFYHYILTPKYFRFSNLTSKSYRITCLEKPWGFQEVEVPRFQDNQLMTVVRLSALNTGHLYPPGNIPCTHFSYSLSRSHGRSAAGRIMSMKNCNDTIGNRTRDLPTCSTVPQPAALRRAQFNV